MNRRFALIVVAVLVVLGGWRLVRYLTTATPIHSTDEGASSSLPSKSSDSSNDQGRSWALPARLQEKRDELLKKTFPDTQVGRTLASIVVLFPQGSLPEFNPQEAGGLAAELVKLRANPDETVNALRKSLGNLPAEYVAERQFLIQFASRLNADRSAIADLLAGEMKTPATLSQDKNPTPSFYNASTALDAMIDVGIEPSKIKQTLQEALQAQTDPAARLLLIGRYERLDPEGAKKLMEAYRAQ